VRFNGIFREGDIDPTDPRIESYLYDLAPRSSDVLAEMEARAEREDIPIVGPLVGRLFEVLARVSGAKRIVELGSAIGYSTIWWAQAVGDDGKVFYTDNGEREALEARAYCRRAGVEDRVEFLVGDALEQMDRVPGELDIVFCDIDKHEYPAALEASVPRLRRGGLFVCDNTLWSGRVLSAERTATSDPETEGVRRINRALYERPDLLTVMLPLRDGVTVAVKR
jgi:predicted O-methyltransferase YrrM